MLILKTKDLVKLYIENKGVKSVSLRDMGTRLDLLIEMEKGAQHGCAPFLILNFTYSFRLAGWDNSNAFSGISILFGMSSLPILGLDKNWGEPCSVVFLHCA